MSRLLGIDAGKGVASIAAVPAFLRDWKRFRSRLIAQKDGEFPFGKLYPCLGDDQDNSGAATGHYFHQDLLVAQRIFQRNPQRHVDVGSRIDGFVAHVASFRQLEVFDIRPLESKIHNVTFRQADLMNSLPLEFTNYCDSLSCLHALEHFGLGRYGDPIDPNGHIAGFCNLTQIVCRGGILYLSVPIGPQRIEFNAHRVFSLDYLVRMFERDFELVAFSYVNDAGDLVRDVDLNADARTNHCGCHYGCGIFELQKR